jgi:ABC-2 type transport system permease protein
MAGISVETRQTPTLPPAARPSYAIRFSHVRTLLWLRWKLTIRGYARSWQRIVGLVFSLVFLLPFVGLVAYGTVAAYLDLPRLAATQILFAVVGGLFLLWAALPLLQYSLNEGLDVTKLQIYPLTRGEQMLSLLLSTLLDVSTLFLVLLLAAIFIGWHATPVAGAVTVVALVAIYAHTVSFSQLVLAALMGLLRTRRFRDITVIVFALFGSVCSLGSQLVSRLLVGVGGPGRSPDLLSLHLDQYVRWTPPGMAAQAIALADANNNVQALPWLAGSLLLIPVLLSVWAWVLDRGITNAESSAPAGRRTRRRSRGVVATANGLNSPQPVAAPLAVSTRQRWRPVSVAALAIAAKDARYLWRDPQLKAALISVLFATVIILFPNIYSPRNGDLSGANLLAGYSVLLAPLPALLLVLAFSQNALGMERQGLQTLFLFPVRPLDIFFGKNLFVGLFAFVFEVALTLVRAAMTDGWQLVPLALVGGLSAVLVMLGCGNVTSVLAPVRWRTMRMGESGSYASENGCLRAVISSATMAVTALLLIPVAAAIVVPLILVGPQWFALSLPLALAYGVALYQTATRLMSPVLLRRGPEILATTVREA